MASQLKLTRWVLVDMVLLLDIHGLRRGSHLRVQLRLVESPALRRTILLVHGDGRGVALIEQA